MQEISENQKYRLYALPAGDDKTGDAEYYFLLPDIDLVYTTHDMGHGVEVTNPEQIPAQARQWLAETIQEIAERYLQENEEAVLTGSKTFLDRFRSELEKEQRKTEKRKIRVKVKGAAEHGK